MKETFYEIGLKECFVEALKKNNIVKPTEIQSAVFNLAIENKDIIGKSETGTGKTLAYLLPIAERVDLKKRENQFIILAPTQELIVQINSEIQSLAKNSGLDIKSIAIINDANINRQIEKLKDKPQIIVGAPGRILELIKKKKVTAHTVKTIVIDEADRMLDKKNLDNVKAVIKTTLKDRQIMLFSATITSKTLDIAKDIMKEPQFINIEGSELVNPNISHYYFVCDRRDKIDILRKIVHAENIEKGIIFINRSDDIEVTTSKLKFLKLKADGIKANYAKEDRKKVMDSFKNGDINLLVSSDLAARGLDIKDVTHIINLDFPREEKDYLHRVGRTARAGKTGIALSIVTEGEEKYIDKYKKIYNIQIIKKAVYNGKIIDTN